LNARAAAGRLRRRLRRAAAPRVIDAFHRDYYNDPNTWPNTYWQGIHVEKCPLDLWVYQEIVFELRPDLIVETGTRHGGSALFFAHLCDILGHGRIVTVDIDALANQPHNRITYIAGSSTDPSIVARVAEHAAGLERVMVILDSDHSEQHVLDELEAYASLVTPGSYLVVEDTNVNGHPAYPSHGPGPAEALTRFLATSDVFEVDREREKHRLTFNPGGYLRRRE
jgi:cephalosporin hydroxylase